MTTPRIKSTRAARHAGDTGANAIVSLNWQPKTADTVWTRQEWTLLAEHLHNDNGPFRFIMGFRDPAGCKQYKRSKTKPVSRAIPWAWSTIAGRAKTKLAFVPYSTNARQQSRWCGFDFDAHQGEAERARELAFAAFRCLLNWPDLFVILEGSGSGGYHVWAIAGEFRPAGDWARLLKSVARLIGTPIQPGLCEIFPPDDGAEFGKGMRAPGCWNPATDTLSEILFENCKPLLSYLSGKSKTGPLDTNELQGHFPDKEKSISFSSPSLLYRQERWLAEFAITQASTRNQKLAALVGESFHQVGVGVAERLATAQFKQKTVATRASLQDHLKSFRALWRGLEHRWLASLSAAEKTVFASLETENERDAFRIVRSFAIKAARDGAPDFPIARDNLAQRLGLTGAGASWIRDKFVRLGVIAKTRNYQPNKAANRFRWLRK
jgi:hypothetical protein